MSATKRLLSLCLVLACAVLALAGCRSAPVQSPVVSPMPMVEKMPYTKIEDAIIRGGLRTDWEIVPSGPREMTGTLLVRGRHKVVVTITYDQTQFSIAYKDSVDMDYKDGKIHPNYNKWVNTLDRNIRLELAGLTK